jgi:hypothetical protein
MSLDNSISDNSISIVDIVRHCYDRQPLPDKRDRMIAITTRVMAAPSIPVDKAIIASGTMAIFAA